MAKFTLVDCETNLRRLVKKLKCEFHDDGQVISIDSPSGYHFDGGSHCIKVNYFDISGSPDLSYKNYACGTLIDCLNTSEIVKCDCS